MDVREYFDAVRAHYLAVLRHAARDAAESGDRVLIEADMSVVDEHGNMVLQDELPYRHDIVRIDSAGSAHPIMPVADHDLAWEPAVFEFGSQFVARVGHLVWNVCVIGARPRPPRAKYQLLRDWFLDWFRQTSEDETPFAGVVHFMSDPEEAGDMVRVQVDLGSAPTAALIELLFAFGQMGCTDGLVYTPEGALELD